MRLIDADALKEYVKLWNIGEGINDRQADFIKAIDKSSTIEDVPNLVHGKWIIKSDNTSYVKQIPRVWIECSHCHWTFTKDRRNDNYCSYCGAKMEECKDEDFYRAFGDEK